MIARIINLVVRRLNAYVGKERIHCLSVVRPVVMTQMQSPRWSRATEIKSNSSLLVIKRSSCVFLKRQKEHHVVFDSVCIPLV